MFQMLTGRAPFNVKTPVELIKAIDKQKVITFPTNISISKECQHLVESLLQVDPLRRISWEEFFLHPWLKLFSTPAVEPGSGSYSGSFILSRN